ncbi:MAG TPA: SRPBCC family protein [Solirubrobacterales bacterium]|nr:SRPBCC family protein [Solirubrobacterales bacterium]
MESEPNVDRLSRFLSAFSIGLGTAQIAVPNLVNRAAGIRDDATTRLWQRIVGVRELVAFAAIEAERPRPRRALWMRFAGDAKDLTLLGLALRGKRDSTPRLAAAIANVAGIAALDAYAAIRAGRPPERSSEEEVMHVKAAITVRKPREEVYRFWRDLENLPSFMDHVEAVEGNGNGRTHWKVKAPAGTTVEWDAEVVEDRPGEAVVWRSVEGSDIQNSGAVRFVDAPRDQGTEVHVEFDYGAPGGRLGEAIAKLFGEEPTQQAKDDLRRFKQVLETGFVVISEGSPEGSTARRHLVQRPGQPPEEAPPQQPSETVVQLAGKEAEPPRQEADRLPEDAGRPGEEGERS